MPPELEPFFATGHTEDVARIMRTHGGRGPIELVVVRHVNRTWGGPIVE